MRVKKRVIISYEENEVEVRTTGLHAPNGGTTMRSIRLPRNAKDEAAMSDRVTALVAMGVPVRPETS